jgi:hypothetical protein
VAAILASRGRHGCRSARFNRSVPRRNRFRTKNERKTNRFAVCPNRRRDYFLVRMKRANDIPIAHAPPAFGASAEPRPATGGQVMYTGRRVDELTDGGGADELDIHIERPVVTELREEHPSTGERRLLIALLEDGVRCYQKYAFSGTRRGRRLFREAEAWFDAAADAAVPFAYVCEVLGVEPDYVRSTLRNWRARHFTGPSVAAHTPRPYAGAAAPIAPLELTKRVACGVAPCRRAHASRLDVAGWYA